MQTLFLRKLLLFSTLLALASPSGWASTELVHNGGFESGSLASWTVTNDCGFVGDAPCTPWSVVSTGVHSGSFAASDQGGYELSQSLTPTSTALITNASFWFKEDPGVLFGVALFYQDGSDTVVYESAADNNWNQYDLLGNLAGGETLIGIDFATGSMIDGSPNGISFIDDISIVSIPTLNQPPPSIPEPTTIVLLGTALLGIAAFRLR